MSVAEHRAHMAALRDKGALRAVMAGIEATASTALKYQDDGRLYRQMLTDIQTNASAVLAETDYEEEGA